MQLSPLTFVIILNIVIIVLLVLTWFYMYNKNQSTDTCRQVCSLMDKTYVGPNTSINELRQPQPPQQQRQDATMVVKEQDYRVLNDPLYPPRNRNDVESTARYMSESRIQTHTIRDTNDSYRLIGYLVNIEDKTDVWKLFAREKYIRRSDADFYASSANKNIDIKVHLTPDVVEGGRLRDLYDLPSEIQIRHPMFTGAIYSIVALPSSLEPYNH